MTKLVVAEIPENADGDFSVERTILGPEMEVRRFTYSHRMLHFTLTRPSSKAGRYPQTIFGIFWTAIMLPFDNMCTAPSTDED